MLSHTLDAVTGIKVDYALEVRITFILLASVQWKPHWRDHIALIHGYNLRTRPFSKLMNKQSLPARGQAVHRSFYCGKQNIPLSALFIFWVLLLFRSYISSHCSLRNWKRENNLPCLSAQCNSKPAIFTDAYSNCRVKTSFEEESPNHNCHLSERTQTGKDLPVGKSTGLRRSVMSVLWTGNPAWPGFVTFGLKSSLWEYRTENMELPLP